MTLLNGVRKYGVHIIIIIIIIISCCCLNILFQHLIDRKFNFFINIYVVFLCVFM